MKTPADYQSVYRAFLETAARFPERPFLHAPASSTKGYADSAISYSYAETRDLVQRLTTGYAALGITEGDRVAVTFDSRLDIYLHLLALNAIGASMVPQYTAATDAEIHYVVDHSDSKLMVAADDFLGRMQNIVSDLAGVEAIASSTLLGDPSIAIDAAGDISTEVALLYTSGTTGKPKGCMLSNEYFLGIGVWYNELGGMCSLDENDRLMTPLPPVHMNALATSFMAMMLCGGCVIQLDRFHPREWWQLARDEGATVIHCLGVMVAILLTLPPSKNDDFSGQIKFCFGPGSDPRHQAVFEDRFGFPLVEAWAMTETGAGAITIACREPRHVGERCIGSVAPDTEFRIVDETDVDVATGQPGELIVRAQGDDPQARFFSGYYKDQAATDEGWRGGWWHTGDVVREGEDGSLFFVDRSKNVIRRSGENIAAVEVEAALLQHALVNNCAVCPVPDEIRGDEVFAFVVPPADAELNTENIRQLFDHCLQHLTYFKVPGYIAVVDALPLTASQKVSRGEVKVLARENLQNNDVHDLRALKKRPKD